MLRCCSFINKSSRVSLCATNVKSFSKVGSDGFSCSRWYAKKTPSASDSTYQFQALREWTTHKCPAPSTTFSATKTELLEYFKSMVTIRRLEMTSDSLYKSKLIRGFCHLAIGQEAIPVGIEAALTPEDAVITAYRCHGFAYTRGASIESIFGELLGRGSGCSKGKGGSMHMFAKEFYGGNGIVGAQVPVGAGIAFAQKYLGKNAVSVILYGDGAANQGQVFEAFNMAKLWSLPCIFICENNKFGMGTSAARSSASVDYYSRGDYVPGIRVDGMDVLAVRAAINYCKAWIGESKGPILLEMDTYRYSGHSMSDPGTTYRTRDDVNDYRTNNDAISNLQKRILSFNLATEEELKSIEHECREQIEKIVEKVKNDPEPSEAELWTDIYVPGSEGQALVKGCGVDYVALSLQTH